MPHAMTGDAIYGAPRVVAAPADPNAAMPPTRATETGDPHDKAEKGPGDWFDDPVVWLCVVAAIASGLLGFRFHFGRQGVEARVDLGDEVYAVLGNALWTIAVILIFKTIASKVEVPGLQKMAAAI